MPGDPLPSWVEGDIKRNILKFVRNVADEASPEHVPAAERVAVFDNDGTLWPEQPLYIQLAFALDRVKSLAPQHPEWRTTQPFQGLPEGDPGALAAGGLKRLLDVIGVTHGGMTSHESRTSSRTGSTPPGTHASTGRTRSSPTSR